jgi:hypothetical protein
VAKQDDRDEGERLDLRRQLGIDRLPNPPDAGDAAIAANPSSKPAAVGGEGAWPSPAASGRSCDTAPPFWISPLFDQGSGRGTIPPVGSNRHLTPTAAGALVNLMGALQVLEYFLRPQLSSERVAKLRRQPVLIADDRVALGEAAQPERGDVHGAGPAVGDQLGHAGAHGRRLLEAGAGEPTGNE